MLAGPHLAGVAEAYSNLGRHLARVIDLPFSPFSAESKAQLGVLEALRREISHLTEALEQEKSHRLDVELFLEMEAKKAQELARELNIKEEMFLTSTSRADRLEAELAQVKRRSADLEGRLRNSEADLRQIRRLRDSDRERLLRSKPEVPHSRETAPGSSKSRAEVISETTRLRELLKEAKEKTAAEKLRIVEIQKWADFEIKARDIRLESAESEQIRLQGLIELARPERPRKEAVTAPSVLEAVRSASMDAIGRISKLSFVVGFSACRDRVRSSFPGINIDSLWAPSVANSKEVMEAVSFAAKEIAAAGLAGAATPAADTSIMPFSSAFTGAPPE